VPLDGIARAERNIIAALHHAGAAGLSDQTFDRDSDFGVRGGLHGVEGTEETCAAGAEDQDVGVVALDGHGLHRLQEERAGDKDRERDRRCREGLLPCGPWQELQRHQAQSAEEVNGEEEDEAKLGDLDDG